MAREPQKPRGCVTTVVGVAIGTIAVMQLAGGIGMFAWAVHDIYRQHDWQMAPIVTLCAALFGSIGLAMLTAIVVERLRARQGGNVNPDAPGDEPWLARPAWAAGRIPAEGGATILAPVLAAMAVWWNVATLPLLAALPTYAREVGSNWAWLALLFPAVGVLLVAAFFYQFFRGQKFGESVFELASVPGVVGGQLAGVVRIPARLPAVDGFWLRLTSVESHFDRKHNGIIEVALWRDERMVTELLREETDTCVPVLFAIPYSAPETSRIGSGRDIQWRLEVWARMPRIDYAAKFTVPVFKSAASQGDFQVEGDRSAKYVPPPSSEIVLRDAGIVREALPDGGVRLTFKAARNWRSALFLSMFPLVFFPVAFAILKYNERAANMFNLSRVWRLSADDGIGGIASATGRTYLVAVLAIGTSVMGFGITVWALDLLLYRSVVEASPRGLTVRGGWLGFGRRRSWAAGDIRQFKTQEYMKSSEGGVWKSVVVVPKPEKGKKRTIGKAISSKLAQEVVIDELNAALGRAAP